VVRLVLLVDRRLRLVVVSTEVCSDDTDPFNSPRRKITVSCGFIGGDWSSVINSP
jgi:hypothetical protein